MLTKWIYSNQRHKFKPTSHASTNDGNQSSALSGTWNAAHDHVGQSNPLVTHSAYNFAVGANFVSFRSAYFIRRSFFDFDTNDQTRTTFENQMSNTIDEDSKSSTT